ncbi:MAG: hypothetical protein LUQ58_03600, partial [Methanomicrobiales archaeon]|nr:hypothetical protein [Methanomicrobiales archaeon]
MAFTKRGRECSVMERSLGWVSGGSRGGEKAGRMALMPSCPWRIAARWARTPARIASCALAFSSARSVAISPTVRARGA